MKKIVTIIYISFAFSAFAHAQNMVLSLGFGPAFYSVKSDNNTAFFNSYNTLYKNILNKPFATKIATPIGWQGVFAFSLGKKALYYSTITVNRAYSDNRATFINNDQRRMRFQFNDIKVDLGSGFRVGKKVAVGLLAGMCFRNSYVKSSFIYNDGTESFTNEKQLNGIFHSLKIMTYLGTSIDVQVHKRLAINLKADFMMGSVFAGDTYNDLDYTKGTINSRNSIPQNINEINNIGYKGLADDTKGVHIAIVLKYLLIDKEY